MEIKDLMPRNGNDTLRIGDSDDLVLMENFGKLPKGKLRLGITPLEYRRKYQK